MWKNYHATIIQNFYKHFIKCDRDPQTTTKIKSISNQKRKYIEIPSPIDPIYRTPYEEKYHFKLIEWPINAKKACVWHFNIISLIEWLNTSKEWINPMTNLSFLNSSINKILKFVEVNNIKKKLKIKPKFNPNEKKIIKEKSEPHSQIYLQLLIKCIIESNENDCFNLLNNNYDKIESDYFKIDEYVNKEIEIPGEKISPISPIHLAIAMNNKNIVHHLLYYGCDLEKKCGKGKYTPLHLAGIYGYGEIGKLIKIYGGNLMAECNFGGKMMNIFDICDNLSHENFVMNLLA